MFKSTFVKKHYIICKKYSNIVCILVRLGLGFLCQNINGYFLNQKMRREKSSCNVFSRVKRVQKPAMIL